MTQRYGYYTCCSIELFTTMKLPKFTYNNRKNWSELVFHNKQFVDKIRCKTPFVAFVIVYSD